MEKEFAAAVSTTDGKPDSQDTLSLQMENLTMQLDAVKRIIPALTNLAKGSEEVRETVTSAITKFAMSIRSMKLDPDELHSFFDYPYIVFRERGDGDTQRHLALPKFCDAQFGYLERVTESFNVFVVNQYVDLLGEVPDHVRQELNIPDPLDLKLDGDYLVGPDTEKAKRAFPEFIKSQTRDGRLLVDKSQHFEFLVRLIKKGINPFDRKPIQYDCFVKRRCGFELRDYQNEIWDTFCQYSFAGIYIPPSTGKTFLGIYGMTHLRGPHIVAAPTTALVEQWMERLELYTDLKTSDRYTDDESMDVFVCTYQSAIKYGHRRKWGLRIIDEGHHIAANQFSKMVSIPCMYGMLLTASPFREDARTPYIFAFGGKAIGLEWGTFRRLGVIQNPDCHVWIVKNDRERIAKVQEIMDSHRKGKALIFSDRIDYGKMLSRKLGIPFVHGKTKNKLQFLKDHDKLIGSRVFDEGISFDITMTVEVKWLFGSRSQELQRVTRTLHNSIDRGVPGTHHIIFTGAEYNHDHKRLFSLYDRGFKLQIHREGVADKAVERSRDTTVARPPRGNRRGGAATAKRDLSTFDESEYPLLKNKRIRNILSLHKKGDRETLLFFLKKGNSLKSFSTEELMDEWGMIHNRSMSRKLKPLLEKGHLKKSDGMYGQNLTRA